MFRYFIKLAYNGTKYHGWQVQPNAISVQAELTKCISLLYGKELELTGCGRTDTGVHAKEFYAHVDVEEPISSDDCENLKQKLNRFLDNSIVVYSIYEVPVDLHARFSAISRTYEYLVDTVKNPFNQQASLFFPYTLNVAAMNEAATLLLKYTDFTSFAKLHSDAKTNNCKVTLAEWSIGISSSLVFTITADRFLRNMVRSIVGTLLDVGTGKLSIDEFQQIIELKNRANASGSAKAHGLYLTKVEYPLSTLHH